MATRGPVPKFPRPQGQPPAAGRAVPRRPLPRVTASRPPPKAEVEPAVLLVGATESLKQALSVALSRHKVFVETSHVDRVIDAVVAAAPDVILLMGDAARDGGLTVLKKLQQSPLSSAVPVVIVHDDVGLQARLSAFRHGAAAVIPLTASIDAIADQVAKLAREIPERGSAAVGEVGEATLKEFVETLSKELRTGILSVGPGSEEEAVRLVLGGGRPIAQLIDEFVQRVRKHMLLAEPLKYEFDERAGGTIQLLEAEEGPPSEQPADIAGLRILLADEDAARADGVAHELRAYGATVAVTDLEPNDARFGRLRQMDPSVLLIDEQHLSGRGYALVRRMRADTRLRWASMLVVRWSEIWFDSAATPAIPRLAGALSQLREPERAFDELVEMGDAFDTRVEIMGPGRLLRAATASGKRARLTVHNPRVYLRVDVSEGLVVGATCQTLGAATQIIEGPAALSALLVLSSGRVRVERVEDAASANVMATADVALNMAEAEPVPIAPSLPAGPPSSHPQAPQAAPAAAPLPKHRSERALQEAADLLDEIEANAAPAPRPAIPPPTAMPEPAQMPRPAESPIIPPPPSAALPAPPAVAPALPAPELLAPPLVAPAVAPLAPPALEPSPAAPAKGRTGLVVGVLASLVGLAGIAAAAWWFVGRERPEPRPAATAQTAAEPTSTAAPMTSAGADSAQGEASTTADAGSASTAEPAPAPPADLTLTDLPVVERTRTPAPTCDALIADGKTADAQGTAKFYVGEARRELMRGEIDAAHRAYCFGVRADANNQAVNSELARLLLLLRGDDEAAEPFARRAAELATKPSGKLIVGDVLARRGQYNEALAVWLEAMKLAPDDLMGRVASARRHTRDGETYLRVLEYAEAERAFLRAAVLDPRYSGAAAGMARSLLRQRQAKAAVAWAKRARDLAPQTAALRVLLGDTLRATNEEEAARAEYLEALQLEPHNSDAQRRLQK